MLKKIFDFFLFSSLFIALCAVLMVHQTNQLFHLEYAASRYTWFVFFSTLASYNFHWYLTPYSLHEVQRAGWSKQHRVLHLFLIFAGLAGAFYHLSFFVKHWQALGIAAVLTFLYSAPKIPHPLFAKLKHIAVGKTLYLTGVWLYVTTILPLVFTHSAITGYELVFCVSRFFLIYSICVVFDYRDRDTDRGEGLHSVTTYLPESGINLLFYGCLAAFSLSTIWLGVQYLNGMYTLALLLPLPVLLAVYKRSKHNFSDYLYYFLLDGLMAISSLATLFMSI